MHACMHEVRRAQDCLFAAALRSQLRERNLTSFVANGSCLPRRSGVDDTPMTKAQVSCEFLLFTIQMRLLLLLPVLLLLLLLCCWFWFCCCCFSSSAAASAAVALAAGVGWQG